MNAFEHQLSILNALAAGKKVQCRRRRPTDEQTVPWIDVAKAPQMLDFVEYEFRITPPGTEPVWAVWDSEAGRFHNQLFEGPAAATQSAISGNSAARNEKRFIPVKLQRADDGA